MIHFYHKIFYHLHQLAIKRGEISAPLTSVVPTIAFLQPINIACALILLDIVGVKLLTGFLRNNDITIYLVVLAVTLMLANYSYFLSDGREKKIIMEYSKKPEMERKRGSLITLVYALVSLILIFLLAPLRVKLG